MWLCMDNGGDCIKSCSLSKSGAVSVGPLLTPNCVARPRRHEAAEMMVGTELAQGCVGDLASGALSYFRALERGYLTDVDVEREVWEQVLRSLGCEGGYGATGMAITMPSFSPKEVQKYMEELVNKHFAIQELRMVHPAEAAAKFEEVGPFCLVVDSGYSFTHVLPLLDGKVFEPAVKRIDVGGKLLTNFLKEAVSYGDVNVLDETFEVNQMKEKVCYVSLDFKGDMEELSLLKRQSVMPLRERLPQEKKKELELKFIKRYVLPDYETVKEGYELAHDVVAQDVLHLKNQIVTLSGECFLVPEILFHPSFIGKQQAGLIEVIHLVIGSCPNSVQRFLRENILLVGGNCLFPNFRQRLERDLGDNFKVKLASKPIKAACLGMKHFIS